MATIFLKKVNLETDELLPEQTSNPFPNKKVSSKKRVKPDASPSKRKRRIESYEHVIQRL